MAENRRSEYGDPQQPLSLRGAMDRLLQDAFVPSMSGVASSQLWPPIDIRNADDAYVVSASVPGVNPDQLDITLENRTLTIRGEIKEEGTETEGDYIYRERKFGRFARSVEFPTRVDGEGAEASYADGTLTLRVPKAKETMPRRIEIRPR